MTRTPPLVAQGRLRASRFRVSLRQNKAFLPFFPWSDGPREDLLHVLRLHPHRGSGRGGLESRKAGREARPFLALSASGTTRRPASRHP